MEKANWIEKIKEAVRVAMNKGLFLSAYKDEAVCSFHFYIGEQIVIACSKEAIVIKTNKGYTRIKYPFTDRDELELQALNLSIKEYREDMAISEFEEFISGKNEEKIVDINDLDDDDNDKE